MLAIMGSTGNIGSKIANMLIEKGERVRVIGRSAERLTSLVDQGAEAAVGDVSDVAFLTGAYKGADAVFAMIPPAYSAKNFRSYYNEIGANIVTAIQGSGIQYVVFLSSHGAQLDEKTGPIKGLYDVEQRLNDIDGVNMLYLRPTFFMENLLANIGLIKSMGINGGGIKGDLKFAMVATKDIAAAAAEHLIKKNFSGKTVQQLLGERDVSMVEATRAIGEKIGKPDLGYVQFSGEEEKKGLMDFGMSDDASDQLVELSKAINDGLIAVNRPRTPENTTRTSIEAFAEFFAQVYAMSIGSAPRC